MLDNGIQHAALSINYGDDYHFDVDNIEFMIYYDTPTINRIKLLNQNTEGFDSIEVFGINLGDFNKKYSIYLSLFNDNDSDYYVLPFGIVLEMLRDIDHNSYNRIVPFHNKKHDALVLECYIERYNANIKTLENMKGDFHD